MLVIMVSTIGLHDSRALHRRQPADDDDASGESPYLLQLRLAFN
jgi:hypothetical protein